MASIAKAKEAAAAQEAPEKSSAGGAGTSTASAQTLYQQGQDAERKNRNDEARKAYAEAVAADPKFSKAHHRLGVVYDKLGKYQQAQASYGAALALTPNDPELLSDVGYSHYLQSQYSKSESFLKRAIAADSDHPAALNNLGLLYGKQGDYDRALAMFRQAGTEAQAQASIATLFPNGRPGASSPEAELLAAAQERSKEGKAPPFPDLDEIEGEGELTAEFLRERMNRIRDQAIAEREARESSAVDTTSTGMPQVTPAMAARPPTAAEILMGGGRVPDHQINDAFAKIDGRTNGPQSPSGNPAARNATQVAGVSPFASPAVPTRDTVPRQLADPRDALPLWGQDTGPRNVATDAWDETGGIVRADFQSQSGLPVVNPANGAVGGISPQPVNPNPFAGQTAGGPPPQPGTGDPARAAALLGMGAGPGQPFPMMDSSAASSANGPGAQPGATISGQYGSQQPGNWPQVAPSQYEGQPQQFPQQNVIINGQGYPQPPQYRQPSASHAPAVQPTNYAYSAPMNHGTATNIPPTTVNLPSGHGSQFQNAWPAPPLSQSAASSQPPVNGNSNAFMPQGTSPFAGQAMSNGAPAGGAYQPSNTAAQPWPPTSTR